MKIGVIPDNPLEAIVLATGQAPTPLGDTMLTFVLARAIMTATKLGVFEALAPGPLPAASVADRCGLHPGAARKLLDTLVSAGYLRLSDGEYRLAPLARKWLLKDSAMGRVSAGDARHRQTRRVRNGAGHADAKGRARFARHRRVTRLQLGGTVPPLSAPARGRLRSARGHRTRRADPR